MKRPPELVGDNAFPPMSGASRPRWRPRGSDRAASIAQLGTLMVGLGVALLATGGVAWPVWASVTQPSLPAPVALERDPIQPSVAHAATLPMETATSVPTATASAVALLPLAPTPEPTPLVASTPPPTVQAAPTPAPAPPTQLPVVNEASVEIAPSIPNGLATHLDIPRIGLTAEVVQGGIKTNRYGELEWETLPFVAVHYGANTAAVGTPGNAVIVGHVVTINEGNVFRNLYRVEPADEVIVLDQEGAEYRYVVTDVQLVEPDAIWVMDPTSDATLTLITCGGDFDSVSRQFSDRLIVTAKLVS